VGRRAAVASTISSAIIVALIVWFFWRAPNGANVRFFFLNPHAFWVNLTGDPSRSLYSILRCFETNVWMFMLCEVLVLIFGLGLAWLRLSRTPILAPLRVASAIYTDVFRGIPIILVLFAVGYGVPGMQAGWISQRTATTYACATLVITYSAYVAEVYRAGMNSVPHGQVMAAKSLGLSDVQTMRRVILPQAVRNVIPPLLNDFISLQKDTALVGTLGILDANQAAQLYGAKEFNFTGYTVAALLFLALTIPMTRYTDHLIAKDRRRRLAGGAA